MLSLSLSFKAERVHELNEEIGKLLAKVEQLGADGNVEESQKVMDEVEKARVKKREAEVSWLCKAWGMERAGSKIKLVGICVMQDVLPAVVSLTNCFI